MKYYPHNIGDFDRATRHLTRIERSVYRDLIDLYYTTEQQLPLDVVWLCRKIIARTVEESTAVEQTLNEFFTKTATGWYHGRCEAEIERYQSNNSQKAEAGRASAAQRALKKQQAINASSTGAERSGNGASTNQNHEPEPITNKQKAKDKAPVAPFFPPDWIDLEIWEIWHQCAKRKGATPKQKQLSVQKLQQWRDDGQDYAGALRNSAEGGWAGLFLPGDGENTRETNHQRLRRERMAGFAPDFVAPQKAGRGAPSFRDGWQSVADITVPGKSGTDPALLKILSDDKKAVPPDDATRSRIKDIVDQYKSGKVPP